MDGQLVFYQFSRSKVVRGDFSHFLDQFAPEKLPTGRRLLGPQSRWTARLKDGTTLVLNP